MWTLPPWAFPRIGKKSLFGDNKNILLFLFGRQERNSYSLEYVLQCFIPGNIDFFKLSGLFYSIHFFFVLF